MATHPASSNRYNLGILDSISDSAIVDILESWIGFCTTTESLLKDEGNLSVGSDFVSYVHILCESRFSSLVQDHFLKALEETFEKHLARSFWCHFDPQGDGLLPKWNAYHDKEDWGEDAFSEALEEICLEKQYQEKCLLVLVHALQTYRESMPANKHNSDVEMTSLMCRYRSMVCSVITTILPRQFSDTLRFYFTERLEKLSTTRSADDDGVYENQAKDGMDIDERTSFSSSVTDMDIDEIYHKRNVLENSKLMKSIGKVVRDLRSLGLASLTEDAYASSIFSLLKQTKVHALADDDYRSSVLESIKAWIKTVPLQFLYALLAYLGESVSYDSPSSGLKSPLASHPPSFYPGIDIPSEGLVRWQLRLEYFAYETLQELRIGKLFEIIVDYPDSCPAIDDLKQCLKYTGQHSKLVESFISSLRCRLLTAGASTSDILHQYVSTIKVLRIIDPTGVFLEAVGEPIREYLKGRKDTRKCIVTMFTDGTGGNPNGPGNTADSLLEESQENDNCEDYCNSDEKQAWINADCWEPDPIETDPLKGSSTRRKTDILGMIVGIIGSKDPLIDEYSVMLAEKLLNKSDYDIDSEIRTLELLKLHFGESSMQTCEIMLNDLINSKRINTNIKASSAHPPKKGANLGEIGMSLDFLDATIISSNFWPPVQEESINLPEPVDQLLSDYAKRFNEIKTPRKLLWKKNLGTVKLELQFGDRATQFIVTPVNAAIIMHFQSQTSWTSKDLAAAVGVPVDALNWRMNFWISKGVITEATDGKADDYTYTLVDLVDSSENGIDNPPCEDLRSDEEGETSVASQEQLKKEHAVYENFIMGMLTNLGSMSVDHCYSILKLIAEALFL
ncbi:hypothetical protein AQUCO_04400028v1 [Aquilegia coerulea]|uniref:Cullin family profile domain-containing protein n=1 Tax=Aquilegia coerulea TaxID=218851 RepID=A0A2G5CMY8_AQUCA|nr:hypothetical protein AQUCO_04400028v1 [Aquilegia coerulea]